MKFLKKSLYNKPELSYWFAILFSIQSMFSLVLVTVLGGWLWLSEMKSKHNYRETWGTCHWGDIHQGHMIQKAIENK